MKKFSKAIGMIFLAACLVFWGADKGLDWLIDHLGIVVLANGDISLPETTEETSAAEETTGISGVNPEETLPSLEETEAKETLPEETLFEQLTPEETLEALEETTAEETTEVETKQVETILIGYTDPVITEPETTVAETVAVNPEDSDEVLQALEKKYFYNILPDREKSVYRKIYYAISQYEQSVEVDNLSNEDLYRLFSSVYNDCPEFFWIPWQGYQLWSVNNATGLRQMDFKYNREIRKLPEIKRQIESIAAEIVAQTPAGTDYQKVKWTYEYLAKATDYVYGDHDQDITSTFLEHKTVCSGYTRAFQYLMQYHGIQSAYMTGMAGEYHAWNLLLLDGEYYWVDVTWGDPGIDGTADFPDGRNITYMYLCANDIMMKERTLDEHLTAPPVEAIRYNYYQLMGTYFTYFNKIDIFERAKEIFADGSTKVEMQFENNEDFRRACEAMEDGFALELAQYYNNQYGTRCSYSYNWRPDMNVVWVEVFP